MNSLKIEVTVLTIFQLNTVKFQEVKCMNFIYLVHTLFQVLFIFINYFIIEVKKKLYPTILQNI
jgi:hypothetical protein